jgi:hypothetical protein
MKLPTLFPRIHFYFRSNIIKKNIYEMAMATGSRNEMRIILLGKTGAGIKID